MNITLLILGIFLIIISIILITINSSNTSEDKPELDFEKEFSRSDLHMIKEIDDDYSEELEIEDTVSSVKLEEFEEEYELKEIDIEKNTENITDQIIKLYKEGYSSTEIAKRLGKGIREIDIILKVNNIIH